MLTTDERDRERRDGRGGGPNRHTQSHRGDPSSRGSRGIISSYFTSSSSRQDPSSAAPGGLPQDVRRPVQNSSPRRSGSRTRDRTTRNRHSDPRYSRRDVPRAAYPPGQRAALKADAQETLRILPPLLAQMRLQDHAQQVETLDPVSLPAGSLGRRPRHARPTAIRVVNSDTLNAALELLRWPTAVSPPQPQHGVQAPPLIVNFASHARPGGGWLNGALAQEEALCYRSSLYLSLSEADYPLGREDILYSPCVVVVRSDYASGHNELTFAVAPQLLPVVSAVSVAALRHPPLRTLVEGGAPVLAYETDRFETKLKMRLTLRAAASRGHDQLVLGALGCGVFGNPPEDVARCWLEVLQEPEFKVATRTTDGREQAAYWWRDVVFAIYDGVVGQTGHTDIGAQGGSSKSNLAIFREVLDGQMV